MVNLEQRIQALEREVQLLKGQIQATLLEINEQLLSQAYPTLMGGDAAPVTPAVPPVVAPQSAPSTRVRQFSLTDEAADDEPSQIQVKPVAASNGRRSRPAELDCDGADSFAPAQRLSSIDSSSPGRDWIELEQWVTQKVEKLGARRTRNLIDLYTEQERLTRRERALLLEFLYVYVDDSERTIPSRSRLLEINETDAIPSPVPSIVPQTRAVVEQIREELRVKRGEASSVAEGKTTGAVSNQQRLVLRLIAGILNAGDSAPNER